MQSGTDKWCGMAYPKIVRAVFIKGEIVG